MPWFWRCWGHLSREHLRHAGAHGMQGMISCQPASQFQGPLMEQACTAQLRSLHNVPGDSLDLVWEPTA